MLKKTITYTDYNGKERTEDCYFHLNKHELMDIAFDLPDGVIDSSSGSNEIHLVEKLGDKGIFDFIKNVLKKAYGVKSEDGRRFEKTESMSAEFEQTPMFDEILMELTQDDKAASEFINNVIPAGLVDEALKSNPKIKSKKAPAKTTN